MQRILKDRRRVYDWLERCGIDVPPHVYMNRDNYKPEGLSGGCVYNDTNISDENENENEDGNNGESNEKGSKKSAASSGSVGSQWAELIEYDDHIEIGGITINKPFVEKPVDTDDHNIAIYYPSSAGGA
mmetsp:Transcript_30932/g.35751  ORF Transcript_30932/g.35751 Transcript_30932/m.35751 type:complete len:129 (+) Transcript_30932:434-820(+)